MSVAGDRAADAATESAVRRDERRAAGVACSAHALHDGFTDVIFVLLPVWQREFGLGYAEVGMLRGIYAGTMATFQIPAAMLAERLGTAPVLALGTALAGVGYCLAGVSTGFALLVLALFVGGLGASAQHPLGSALIARAFAGPRSLKALGTYNFAGDIGKMSIPAAAALLLTVMTWQPAVVLLGVTGLACAVVIFFVTPRYGPEPAVEAKAGSDVAGAAPVAVSRIAFPVLLSIGVIDSAIRMAFLYFPTVPAHRQRREPADHRPRADAGVRGWRRRQARVRVHRRAHRHHCNGMADRRTHGRPDPGAAAAVARSRYGAAAGDRPRAQRHVVGALWIGAGSGRAGAALPRLQHFLHGFDRRRRARAAAVRHCR